MFWYTRMYSNWNRYSQCNHYSPNRFDVIVAFWKFNGDNNNILHRRYVILIVLFVFGATYRLNKNRRATIFCCTLSIIKCSVKLFIVFGDKLSRSPSELRKTVRIDIFSAVCLWLILRRRRMSHAPRSRRSTRFMMFHVWSGTLEVGCRATGGRRNLLLSSCAGIAYMIRTRYPYRPYRPSFWWLLIFDDGAAAVRWHHWPAFGKDGYSGARRGYDTWTLRRSAGRAGR